MREREMKSKASSDRGFGQISLSSSFLIKPLSGDSNKENHHLKPSKKKNPSISLSEFLNRKLERNSIRPKTVQSKQNPFSSIGASKGTNGSVKENVGGTKRRSAEIDQPLLDVTVFKQLKYPRQEIENYEELGSVGGEGGHGGSANPNEQDLSNRTNPFRVSTRGGDERATTSKYLVVLGGDPKPKQKWRKENFMSNEKPRPFFNHYANGSGWWDCNMAGVDNEEVGCKQAWEGVGSTTLGGLEWH